MATAPQAISRFLLAPPPAPPFPFKGADPRELRAKIERIGGHPLLTKTVPRPHQLEGLAFALWAERALLLYEMRTGKTKLALDFISYLVYSGLSTRKALIICHAPIGVDEWEHQGAQHSHLELAVCRSGEGAAMRLLDACWGDSHAVVASWSTLQQVFSVKREAVSGAKKGKEKLYANHGLLKAAAEAFDIVVIDEIHMAGHHDTLRFAIASKLVAECRWRLGLTGTPFGRDPLLLWAQAFLIDGGTALTKNFYFFRDAFCTTKYSPFTWDKTEYTFDSKKLPLLREKISGLALHCALSEVQDVAVLSGVVELSMSPEQARAYAEALESLVKLHIGQTVEIDNAFVRLRQIASGYLPFIDSAGETRIVDFPDATKYEWLADFMAQKPELQMVIFHTFIHTGERICKLLAKAKVKHEWLHGGSKERPQLLKRFQSGKSQVLVANTATGGIGIDLSAADYLLFFESPDSVITRRQAEARPLARGNRPLVMDDLVCAPIEKKLLDFIQQGETLRTVLLRDHKRLGAQLAL